MRDILAEAAGITTGSWYAWPSDHVGHELITAGMLIMAGGGNGKPLDYDELERWTRIGCERGMRSRHGERRPECGRRLLHGKERAQGFPGASP